MSFNLSGIERGWFQQPDIEVPKSPVCHQAGIVSFGVHPRNNLMGWNTETVEANLLWWEGIKDLSVSITETYFEEFHVKGEKNDAFCAKISWIFNKKGISKNKAGVLFQKTYEQNGVWITIPLKQGLKRGYTWRHLVWRHSLNHNSIKTRIETLTAISVTTVTTGLNHNSIKTRIETILLLVSESLPSLSESQFH